MGARELATEPQKSASDPALRSGQNSLIGELARAKVELGGE
jgi:hypothetical protein